MERLQFFKEDKIYGEVLEKKQPVCDLCAFAESEGVNGNVWKHYLAYRILTEENPLTLALERGERGGIVALSKGDWETLFTLFQTPLEEFFGEYASVLENYDTTAPVAGNERLADFVKKLNQCDTEEDFFLVSAEELQSGAGIFGAHHAFRLITGEGEPYLEPILSLDNRPLSHLVGYELQKKKVLDNTVAFLDGKPANNVLLYGDAGTGKSSTIKGLLADYADRGLRVIELYKHQYNAIHKVISQIENRNFKFLLYMDDLSFEEFEVEYKYFKAVLEGGLGKKPDNVLIYATSNRRHLIKETWADRNDMRERNDEINTGDTLQEKLSLSARFGLTVFYPSPGQQEYLNIVKELAARESITLPEEELNRLALQWCMRSTGKSGRTAEQFIKSLKR